MRTRIASLASMILALAATASAGTITFFDGTFNNPPGWTGSQVASTAGITSPSFAFTTVLIGGASNDSANRGDGSGLHWEQDTHSFTGTASNNGMRFLNIDPAYTFTGSFSSLSYSYNLQDAGSHNVAYSIAILQGGNVYTGPLDTVTPNGTTWSANGVFGMTNLTPSSFFLVNSDLSLGPALSTFSGTMEFGYLVANSFIGTGSASYQSGIDNWSVTLNNAAAAPEPTSYELFGVGMGGLAVLRRRRRFSTHKAKVHSNAPSTSV